MFYAILVGLFIKKALFIIHIWFLVTHYIVDNMFYTAVFDKVYSLEVILLLLPRTVNGLFSPNFLQGDISESELTIEICHT